MLKDEVHKLVVSTAEDMFKSLWPALELYDSKLTLNNVKQEDHNKLILDAVQRITAMMSASFSKVADGLSKEAKELKHE